MFSGWGHLQDVQMGDVPDGEGGEALAAGAGVAKEGVGWPAAAPHAAITRLVFRDGHPHGSGRPPLSHKARLVVT